MLRQDLAFGFRQLRKSPGYAAVSIGSLALGIGASVAVFSVVRAVLLDPYPYKDADRMVHVELRDKSPRRELLTVNSTQFKEVQQLPAVDDVFLQDDNTEALTSDSLPVSVTVGRYSTNLFTYMGVPPLIFPDGDVLGKSVRSPALKFENPNLLFTEKSDDWLQIIGVVDDARNDGLDRPIQPQLFLPASFVLDSNPFLLLRSKNNPAESMRAVAQSVHRLNPEMFAREQHELNWLLDMQAWGKKRFLASIFAVFGILALVLAATGVYSVVSYTVSQRTKEFGVRMALGAQRVSVVRLVLQSSLLTVALGAAAGIVLSLALGKLIVTSSHATVHDPTMLLDISVLLLSTTALACIYPAWRAASIDPIQALRTD